MPKGIKGFQKGHQQFNTGKTHFKKGHKLGLGKHWKVKDTSRMKGRIISEETRKKLSKSNPRYWFGKKGSASANFYGFDKKAYNKQWQKEHKDLVCYYARMRYYRLRGAEGNHTYGEWENLKAQHNYTCLGCKKREPEIKLEADHIIPISKGGSNNIENIQPLCRSCNAKKYNKIA